MVVETVQLYPVVVYSLSRTVSVYTVFLAYMFYSLSNYLTMKTGTINSTNSPNCTNCTNILSDEQYLYLLHRKRGNSLANTLYSEYAHFCQNIATQYHCMIAEYYVKYGVDIQPYLYTVSTLTRKEFTHFLRFCRLYLTGDELGILADPSLDNQPPVPILSALIKSDHMLMYAIVVIMQYYFL
jgi:hypothetical protein